MLKRALKPPDLSIVSVLTLIILLLYSYTYLFVIPYLGSYIQMTSGEVLDVIPNDRGEDTLMVGDIVITAGEYSREEIIQQRDRFRPIFSNYEPGDTIQYTVMRDGELITVDWIVPGPTFSQVWTRIFNVWWMAFIFWGFGVLTLWVVRIRDTRWRLLVWFFNLSAIWIAAGVVSASFVFFSSLVLHAMSWLLVAVMLHLHAIFPEPLSQLKNLRPYWVGTLYTLCFALAVAELFQLLPWASFLVAVGISLLGSIFLLLLHYWLQPETRWAVRIVMAAIATVAVGGLVFWYFGFRTEIPNLIGGGVLFAPLIPAAYFYSVMRRRLGPRESLLTQFVVRLVFGIFLLSTILIIVALMSMVVADGQTLMLVGISLVVIVGFIGSMFYGRYQHFIENRFLGKQHSVDELVQTFGQRLVTRLTLEQLVGLLSDEVMPGLRIKQGALLRFHGFDGFSPPNDVEVLCSVEVEPDLLPDPLDVMALLAHAGQYRPPPEEGVNVRPCSWVRLTLPLKHEGRVIGMCLMGERTPDNFYSYSEIPILQALIDQTSLALMNIEQANLLLQLSRRELARYESERLNMAHELHDEVLAQMAVLAQSMSVPSDAFLQSYQDAVQRIRNVISGLRPATLEQLGLQTALEELLDDLTERSEHMEGVDPLLELDLTPDRSRYDHEVELHLFRIVQQASYNVLEHAQAQKLTICGRLEQDIVELEVIDDGVGFQNGNPADFGSLLAHQHFGLVTMHERANLIGAHVEITSTPGEGTRVKVIWREQESRAGIGNVAEQSSE